MKNINSKKVIALILSCLILVSYSVVTFAAANPIVFEDGVRVKTSDFHAYRAEGGAPTIRDGGTAISRAKHIDFNLVPPKPGVYKLELQHKAGLKKGNGEAIVYIEASFVENGLNEFIGMPRLTGISASHTSDDWDTEGTAAIWETLGFASFPTTAQRTLRLSNVTTPGNDGPWTGAFKLTYVEPVSFVSADIESEIARGTDTFVLNYSGKLDETRLDEVVIEVSDSDGNIIMGEAVEVTGDDENQLVVALNGTLDYEKSYTLSVDKVPDSLGYPFEDMDTTPALVQFSTTDEVSDTNDSNSSVTIDSIETDNLTFTIEGTIKGSKNQCVAGRKITATIKSPAIDAQPEKIPAVISGENGKFTISYTLDPDSIGGIYEFEVGGEYVASTVSDTKRYLSKGEIDSILKELDDAKSVAEVKEVLETYETELGILEFSIDYKLIFPDSGEPNSRNSFLKRFIDSDFKVEDGYDIKVFNNVFLGNIVLEHMSQTDDDDVIEKYIEDREVSEVLGLDLEKYNLISRNKDTLLTEITALDAEFEAIDSFKTAFDKLVHKYFLIEKVGYDNITLKADTASARQGEEFELTIESVSKFSKIKEITLVFTFGDALDGEFDDLEVITELGEVTLSVKRNFATCVISNVDSKANITEIAKISLTGGRVGAGTVNISGKMDAETGTDYTADINITSIDFTATITAQQSQEIGGGGNTGLGGSSANKGSSSSSSGNIIKPTIAPQDTVDNASKGFLDLAEAPWANEAIMGLYNMQSIAMPDDGMFYPNRNITRAEFIKMVVLAKNYVTGGSTVKVNFADVDEDDWYYQYVKAGINGKLIEGDGSGNFRPNDLITREDICVILSRISKSKTASFTGLFADDSSISDYAKNAVYVMKESGIVNGVGDNLFAPKANATRAMAAKIIYGLVK